MTEIYELTALELGRAIHAAEVSPREVARHCLDRIQAIDGGIGAFMTVTDELAMEQARAAERAVVEARRTGVELGPLHGVPVAVKDTARVEGVRCTRGSLAYADDVADIDDHVVTRMKEAGLVIVGTTNTPEFALPCYTENRVAPATRNPWSLAHSPGGSSGGSGAAVAAGMVPIAHGTDAGGSIRIPASACGLVGIKPSRGRVSNGPVDHDVTGLSVHGVLARSVADAAALLDVLAGTMPGDAYTAPPWPPGSSPRLRVAVMPEPMAPGVSAHPDCMEALQRAIRLLEEAGHCVEEVEMSPDQEVADAFGRAWAVHAARIPVAEEDEEKLMPFTRHMRDQGLGVTGIELHAALAMFRGIGQMLADFVFSVYDVMLTPTLATLPALIGAFSSDTDQAADYRRMTAFMPYTPVHNIAGVPAISLPLHWSPEGLPIGVMIGGRYGEERALLALATEMEALAGYRGRRPVTAR